MQTYNLDFRTAYNSFSITSDHCKQSMTAEYDSVGYEDRLLIYKNSISVRTEAWGRIRGKLYLVKKEPTNGEFSKYDHIVEGGLDVSSGKFEILDIPNSHVQFSLNVKPGKYRVRVYTINMVGFDSDDPESGDSYKIEIWPSEFMERRVLKRFVKQK